jgi:hypothetical protein
MLIARQTAKCLILTLALIGLPLIGVRLAGIPVSRYLEFPPRTQYVEHAPFSWPAFWMLAVLIAAVIAAVALFLFQGAKRETGSPDASASRHAFPWWGWAGAAVVLGFWILAWTRFEWFSDFQKHTFLPLWIGYILVVNGICRRNSGGCLLTDRPGFFAVLFPASAGFWWFFEYLNRFVQNWFYRGVHYESWEYFALATLSFSTVLPAVLSTRELLLASGRLSRRFDHLAKLNPGPRRLLAPATLLPAAIGLALIGVLPNYLFPLLWVCPLLVITGLHMLWNEPHLFSQMADGRWAHPVAACLAALVCGFFWEMWNYCSLAKWEYSIPFVQRFQIFEMPLLGYAGYLPFGLECAAIGGILDRFFDPQSAPNRISGPRERTMPLQEPRNSMPGRWRRLS